MSLPKATAVSSMPTQTSDDACYKNTNVFHHLCCPQGLQEVHGEKWIAKNCMDFKISFHFPRPFKCPHNPSTESNRDSAT